jgi:DME family drug/metabolite transporter
MLFAAVFLLLDALLRRGAAGWAVGSMAATAAVVAGFLQGRGVVELLRDPRMYPYALGVGALTAASLLLLAVGMSRTRAFDAAVITGVEPLAATVLAVVLLGEGVSATQAVGGLAVVAGVTGISMTADAG